MQRSACLATLHIKASGVGAVSNPGVVTRELDFRERKHTHNNPGREVQLVMHMRVALI